MPGNHPADRPKIDVDALDLSSLFAKAVVLRECLRERSEPGLAPQELEALRDRTRKAVVDVRKELLRLGVPGRLYAGDLEGESRKCRAVEAIYQVARTLRPKRTVWSGWTGFRRDLEAAVSMVAEPEELSDVEQAVVTVLRANRSQPLMGPTIATRAGYAYDYTRKALAALVRRGVIRKTGHGYSL
jgi:hypothetical protein